MYENVAKHIMLDFKFKELIKKNQRGLGLQLIVCHAWSSQSLVLLPAPTIETKSPSFLLYFYNSGRKAIPSNS